MIVLPLNRCHDSSQYSPSSSLLASCNDCAGIFKRLADTAFLFFSRFFQPHCLIINIPAFVARAEFFGPHGAKFFCVLTLCRFCFVLFFFFLFGRGKQAGSLLLYLMFSTQQTLRQRGNWYANDLMSKHHDPLMSHDIFGIVGR